VPALLAALAAGSCTASPAADQADWPEGIYGNVDMSPMTGDLGGFEVRFYRDGGRQMAEFVLCEGWCNRAYTAEVERAGDELRFSHVEELIEYTDGKPTPVEGRQVAYRIARAGEGLRYRYAIDGEPMPSDPDANLLLPLQKPFGLAVAKDAN
jgi:hypothetical protein